ncbi:MAG: hypothetical protein RLZZ524_1395, partial [Pseudomonadota bacterium]
MPFNPATAKPINAAPAGSQPAAPRKFNPATARPLPKASDLRPTDEGTGWIGATAASIAGNLPLPRQVRDTLIAAPSAVVRGVGRAVQGIEEAAADTLTYGPDAQLATLGPLGGAIASTAAGARALGFGPANPVKAPGIGAAVVQGTQQVDRFGTSLQRQAAAETSGFGVEGDLLSPSTWRARPGATAEGVAANAVSTFGEMVPIMAIGRGAGAGAAMTTAAGQSYAGNREEQARRIMEMPPEQVATLPGFRDLVEAGLAPEQAHQALAELAGATAGATAAPFAALSGLILGGPISDPIKRFLVGRLGVNRAAEIAARLGAGAVPPVLEGLQEAGEGVLARAGANQATGQQGGLTEGSLENFVGGAFGGLAGSVGDAGVPVESARARRAREDDEAAIDESAADAALRTADPGLVDIINGQQRAGALPAPPDATAWRVDPRGNVQVPGTNPPLLTARAGVGADFVVGPSGVATPGPTTEIAQPAPAPGGLREVDRSVRGPSAGLAPAQIPEPGPQARIDPATGALVGVPQGRELVPFGAVPPAPVEPNRSTPPTSNTPQPAPDDPDADLNDPKMQRLMALDPENPANAAEFGLPPAPKRSGSAWAFPSPREISARIKATPKATKQSVTRSLFNPRYHDALDFLTLEGGLDRTAWMGAKGKRGEGVDPAVLRAKGNDATNRRFAGVGAPSLFPSSGGLTPSEARERLQGAGFLQADPESGVATSDDRDAVELVMESLNQGRRFYSSNPDAQDFRAALGEVKRRQLDFAQRQEQRKAEDAEAAVLGTDREGLRRLVREMESRGEVQQAVTFDDANDGATIAEWAIRADNAGVPEADVMNALAGEGFIPRADIARQLAELI